MEGVSIWHPANRPLSASLVEEMLDSIQIDLLFVAPSILEDMSQFPDAVAKLSKLQAVHFGGGEFQIFLPSPHKVDSNLLTKQRRSTLPSCWRNFEK
jgi:hypothetical protein